MSDSPRAPRADSRKRASPALADVLFFLLYVLIAVLAGIQSAFMGARSNNFSVFRWSFYNLIAGTDLYVGHPGQHQDLFKYSPTFALLFLPFALLPRWAGLILWDLTNVMALYWVMSRLLPSRQCRAVLALIFIDVVRTTQNCQSNALVAALVIVTFIELKRGRPWFAAMAVSLGASIKVFPLAGAAMGLLHPGKKRFAASILVAGVALLALPLLVVTSRELILQYASWLRVESGDIQYVGFPSVMGLAHTVLGIDWPVWGVMAVGTLILLGPILQGVERIQEESFGLLFLSSLLIYMTIFNPQSESSTYIVATSGAAIWFVTSPKAPWRMVVMAMMVLVVSVSTMFWVPDAVRHFINTYCLQALPALACWIAIQVDLWRSPPGPAGGRLAPEAWSF